MGSNESDYFEIATDKVLFKKGGTASYGAPPSARVESYSVTGDWVDIHLSGGHTLSLPEARVAYILTRDAA